MQAASSTNQTTTIRSKSLLFFTQKLQREQFHSALFWICILGTDPEDTIVQAFKLLDPDQKGVIHKD